MIIVALVLCGCANEDENEPSYLYVYEIHRECRFGSWHSDTIELSETTTFVKIDDDSLTFFQNDDGTTKVISVENSTDITYSSDLGRELFGDSFLSTYCDDSVSISSGLLDFNNRFSFSLAGRNSDRYRWNQAVVYYELAPYSGSVPPESWSNEFTSLSEYDFFQVAANYFRSHIKY